METLAQRIRAKHPGAYDDMTDAQLEASIDKKFPGAYADVPRSARQEPALDPAAGMSWLDAFGTATGKGMVDIGRGIKQRAVENKIQTPFLPINAANMAGTAIARAMFGSPEQVQTQIDESKRLDAPLMEKPGSGWGQGTGMALASLPLAFAPGAATLPGAVAFGGMTGAVQPTATGESPYLNAAAGGAGGGLGHVVGSVIGRAIAPVRAKISSGTSKLLQRAEDMGIPLSLGTKTQSVPLQTTESVLENIPFTAGTAQQSRQATQEGFNRAVTRTIGENAPEITPELMGAARSRIGGEFERLSGQNVVNLGDDFLNALSKVEAAKTEFTSPAVKGAVEKALNLAAKGQISGQEYQLVRSSIGMASKDAFSGGDSEVGQALKTIKNALDDAATSSISAADRAAWDIARQQWSNLRAIEPAVMPTTAGATAGNVSGAKLAYGVKASNPKALLYTPTGRSEIVDLARIGQAFVKPQIANSGTPQRMLIQQMLTGGALGGGTYLATGDPETALGAAGLGVASPIILQAAMRSPAIQSYIMGGQQPARIAAAQLAEALMAPVGASALLGAGR